MFLSYAMYTFIIKKSIPSFTLCGLFLFQCIELFQSAVSVRFDLGLYSVRKSADTIENSEHIFII